MVAVDVLGERHGGTDEPVRCLARCARCRASRCDEHATDGLHHAGHHLRPGPPRLALRIRRRAGASSRQDRLGPPGRRADLELALSGRAAAAMARPPDYTARRGRRSASCAAMVHADRACTGWNWRRGRACGLGPDLDEVITRE